jgi:hypothetical protein
LFRKAGDTVKINELGIHFSKGNYSIIAEYSDNPHEVANFFKQMLRELSEPVCPYSLYTKFRDFDKIDLDSEQNKIRRTEEITEILLMMP